MFKIGATRVSDPEPASAPSLTQEAFGSPCAESVWEYMQQGSSTAPQSLRPQDSQGEEAAAELELLHLHHLNQQQQQ